MSEQEKAVGQESVSSPKAQNKAKTPAKKTEKKPNRIARWFKDLRGELKKVTWPTKKDMINYSIVVLVFIVIMGVIIGVIDLGAGKLVELLVS